MHMSRVRALVWKDLLELRRNRSASIPMLLTMLASLLMPFVIVIAIPALTGEGFSESDDLTSAISAATAHMPGLEHLTSEAAIQAFLFQQFLIFLMLVPVAGAMSLAAHSVIGEKQARALEPLLATPITTAEFVAAKVTSSVIPALIVEAIAVIVYFVGIGRLAEPGVLGVMFSVRTFLMVAVLGPLAALIALQLAVMVSSRVNDARAAQQIGVLVIMPIVGLMVAQFSGLFFLSLPLMLLVAVVVLVLWLGMFLLSVLLFRRETILTRWS